MEELRGWTAIDTLYELKGFQIAAAYFGPLHLLLGAVVFGFGIVRVLYRTTETNRYRELVVYVCLAVVLFALIAPVDVPLAMPAGYTYDASLEELVESARGGHGPAVVIRNVPRLMAWSHAAIDTLSRLLVRAVDGTFEENPFGHDRAAVLLRLSRIRDAGARDEYHQFVAFCYVPLLARFERVGRPAPNPYYDPFKVRGEDYDPSWRLPDSVSSDDAAIPGKSCRDLAATLYQDLTRDVEVNHPTTLQAVHDVLQAKGGFAIKPGQVGHAIVTDIVLRYVLHNETAGFLSSGEIADLRRALPDYEMFDRKSQTSGNSQDVVDYARTAISWIVKTKQSIDQWIDHHAAGPATYHKVVSYGPYVYGLSGMLILAVFPLVAFICLLPGYWMSLFGWMKLLLGVKLWMVFWAILSRFNEFRYRLEDVGSGAENGIGDQTYIFPAIAVMYLLTPGLSVVVVQLLSAAGKGAAGALSNFAGAGAHSGAPQAMWNKVGQQGDEDDGVAGAGGGGSAPGAAEASPSPQAAGFWERELPGGGALQGDVTSGAAAPGGGGGEGAPAPPPPPPVPV